MGFIIPPGNNVYKKLDTDSAQKAGFFSGIGKFFKRTSSSQPQQTPQLTTINPLSNGRVVSPNEVKLELSANPSNPSQTQKNEEITENFIQITPDVFVKQVFEQVKTIISSSNSNRKEEIINIIDNCIEYINNPKDKIIFTESSSNLDNSKLYYQLVQGFCYNVAYIFRDILEKKPGSNKLLLFQNQYNALSETYNKIVGNSAEVIRELEDEIQRSNCENKKLSEIQGIIAADFNKIIAEQNAKLVQLQAKCPAGDCDELDDDSDSDCEVCDEKPLQATQSSQAQTNVSQISQNPTQQVAVGIVATEEDKKKAGENGLNGSRNNASNSRKITELEQTILNQTTEIAGKENEIKGEEAEISELREELEKKPQANSKRLEAELNKKQEELDTAKKATTNSQAAIREVQSARNAALAEKNAALAEKNAALAEKSKAQTRISTAQAARQEAQAARQEAQAARTAALAENQLLRKAAAKETEAKEAEAKKNAAQKAEELKVEKNILSNLKVIYVENITPLYNKLLEVFKIFSIKFKSGGTPFEDIKINPKYADKFKPRFEELLAKYKILLIIPTETQNTALKINLINFENLLNTNDIETIKKEYKAIKDLYQDLINLSEDMNGSVRVVIRIKPLEYIKNESIMKFNPNVETNKECKESSIIPIFTPINIHNGGVCATIVSTNENYPQDETIKPFKSFNIRITNTQKGPYENYYNIFSDPPFSNFGTYSGIPFIKDFSNILIENSSQNNTVQTESQLTKYINQEKDKIKQYYQEQNLRTSFEQVKQGYSIVLFGYGYSGSGKTFTLLGAGNTKGILQYGMEDMNYDNIELAYVFEEYSDVNIDSTASGLVTITKIYGKIYGLYKIDDELSNFIKTFKADANISFDKILTKKPELKTNFTTEFTSMSDEITKLRKETINPRIKATINNKDSSRSHLYIVFKITTNSTNSQSQKPTIGYITIIDMAGRENPISIINNLVGNNTQNTPCMPLNIAIPKLDKTKDFITYIKEKLETQSFCIYTPLMKEKITKYLNLIDGKNENGIDSDELKSYKIIDKNTYIYNIIKEGFYINESINHLKYYFLNKNDKCKYILAKKNNLEFYDPENYYIDTSKYLDNKISCCAKQQQETKKTRVKKDEIVKAYNIKQKKQNGSLVDGNCLTIPILQFLDYGIRGITTLEQKAADDKPTKFIMICAIRQEPSYANDVIDTLAFADSIKST